MQAIPKSSQWTLGICIPGESMPMESVRCLGRLIMRLCTDPPYGLSGISQHLAAGSILPQTRAEVCGMAIRNGCSHLLLLDSDMIYPETVVHQLAKHGRPFVAANATTRRPPIRWTAKDTRGRVMNSNKERGLAKAGTVGLAVALIETRVYQALPTPPFQFEHTSAGWIGEDVFFCRQAIEAGFQPMIDHDLSRKIGHHGAKVFYGGEISV